MTRAGSHMQDRRLGLYQTLCLVDILCCSRSLHEGCNQYLELVVVVAEPVAAETAPDLMAVDTWPVGVAADPVAADTDLVAVDTDLMVVDIEAVVVAADPVAADTDLMAVDTEPGLSGDFGLGLSLHLVLCRDQNF